MIRRVALLPLLVVIVACNGAAPASPSPSPGGPPVALLRVESYGGLAGLRVPPQITFVLYDDGRVMLPVPQLLVFPGPAMPGFTLVRLKPSGVTKVVDAALAAGLADGDRSYSAPGVMDAQTVRVTTRIAGRRSVIEAYALWEAAGSPQGRPADLPLVDVDPPDDGRPAPGVEAPTPAGPDAEAREVLRRFLTELGEIRQRLPEDILAGESAYEPEAVEVTARRSDGVASEERPAPERQPPMAWPLATPLASFGAPLENDTTRCGAVSGSDLPTLLAAVRGANQLTPWTSEGREWALTFRPLLPGEQPCVAGLRR
jgi:hypothetical protein